jgi:tetratricopeptide (TPR) repeat protein
MIEEARDFHGCTPEETEALDVFFAGVSEQQHQAWILGTQALLVILSPERTPELEAEALIALTEAATLCPFAAYSLGKVLEEHGENGWVGAEESFRHCAALGLPLAAGADEPFENSATHRRVIRDIIARAITNIGSHYGNEGHPEQAIAYFDRALEIDPGNRPALVSRANITFMDEGHLGRAALAAVEDWREADRSPRFVEEFDTWTDGRRNVVAIVDGIRENYGEVAAEKWAGHALRGLMNIRDMTTLAPRVRRAVHLPSVAGVNWPAVAVDVAEHLHAERICEDAAAYPLELRVTLAGALLASLSRGSSKKADPELLDRALSMADGAEPLNPLLGDHEWKELRRPQTDYLMEDKTVRLVNDHVQRIDRALSSLGSHRGAEVALGVLFHLDTRFRYGVTQMMRSTFANSQPGFIYVPALSVG